MSYNKNCILFLGCFFFILLQVYSQDQKIADSLSHIYEQNILSDSTKFVLLSRMSFNEVKDINKGLKYADDLITLAENTNNPKYLEDGYFLKGRKKGLLGKLGEALDAFFKSAEIARKIHNFKGEAEAYGAVADIYSVANNHPNAMLYYNKAIISLRHSTNDSISLASVLSNAGDEYVKSKNYDSALMYFNEAKLIFEKVNYLSGIGYSLGGIGMVYARIGKNDLAEKQINEAIRILETTEDYYPICDYLISMADVYLDKKNNEIALTYMLRSFHLAEQFGLIEQIANASLKLSEFYEKTGNTTEAFKYYKTHIAYRDSINNLKSIQNMADRRTAHEVSKKQTEVNLLNQQKQLLNQQKQNEKKLTLFLGIILGLTIIILGILIKNNQSRRKAYKTLNLQKQETDRQKAKSEIALSELQVTQKQLIHTAKLASLGEVTAGIAHEIQNPLNFVNNFSELSVELLNELREGLIHNLTGSEKTEVEGIINNLEINLKKIENHGKRADSIVKGMLQHTRTSKGKKEPTNINALADEYLRLSFHGIRSKDKEFKINFKTDFDQSIGKIEVLPQDIGRVLLNLYNNAFYSVLEKNKQENDDFKPLVFVSTKKAGNKIEISVKDNGMGIPQKVLDKIFQPFFTTKPAGQGTGLGLSLSYDIIKAHGGEFKIETKEGEFAEFIIQLPA